MDELSAKPRPVARVLLFDDADRILLLYDADAGGYWYTPGGGIEAGETAEEAALRELREELGLAVDLGEMVLRRRTRFEVRGRQLDQDVVHFLGRVRPAAAWAPVSVDGDAERAAVCASRWWTVDELAASNARFFPDSLVELVRRAVSKP